MSVVVAARMAMLTFFLRARRGHIAHVLLCRVENPTLSGWRIAVEVLGSEAGSFDGGLCDFR